MTSSALADLRRTIRGFLQRMGLPYDPLPAEGAPILFKYGSTALMLTTFEEEGHTFVRFASTLLLEVQPTVQLVTALLRMNTEVLLGSFLLFEDGTLSFAATLLGDKLDYSDFEFVLQYVATLSDDMDDPLQSLAGGSRAQDLFEEE